MLIDFVQNVAGDQQVHALLAEFLKEGKRFSTRHGVQSIERFVEHEDARMMGDGLGETDFLTHALAVAGDLASGGIAKLDAVEGLHGELVGLGLAACRGASSCQERIASRRFRGERNRTACNSRRCLKNSWRRRVRDRGQ